MEFDKKDSFFSEDSWKAGLYRDRRTRVSDASEKWNRDHLDAERNSASLALSSVSGIRNHVAVANFRATRMRAVFLFFLLARSKLRAAARSLVASSLPRTSAPSNGWTAVNGGRTEKALSYAIVEKGSARGGRRAWTLHAALHFSPTPLLWY